MRPLTQDDVKTMRGITLRRDPAREACFTVVQNNTDLHDFTGMGEVSRRQRLHRHMHNEMQNLEITAQTLVDFPEAAWDLRMQFARQCWDEVRHTLLVKRRFDAMGGRKGEFPVMNYEWGLACVLDTLAGRLAIQNRTFEAGELDLFRSLIKEWREAGDFETAEILDGFLADEIQHVRFANQWLKRAARENPRTLMTVARAILYMKQVGAALAPEKGETNAVGVPLTDWKHLEALTNVEDRRLADFSEDEIAHLLRAEGFGELAAEGAADGRAK